MESGHGGRRHVPVEEEGSDSEGEKEEGEVGEQVIIIKMKILLFKKKNDDGDLINRKKDEDGDLITCKKDEDEYLFCKKVLEIEEQEMSVVI